ncbi:MAG TPA: hypothetical protein VEP90_03505 [Methylomirabilota bacterium]|nr:hypothetical protein [Methylomirabilota bacterium]
MSNTFYKVLFATFLTLLIATGTSTATVVVNVIILLGLLGIYLGQGELGLVIYK